MCRNFNNEQETSMRLIFDYGSGLTTTEEETFEAERLIGTNEQAAKLHSALKFITNAFGCLESELCPNESAERTILRLKSLADRKQ
jgi:hypothetical protein